MASTKPRYDKEEIAKRGDELYERKIRPQLSAKDDGKLCAIDIDSGTYVVDPDELNAFKRLRERVPDALIWMVRVGSRYVHRFGGPRIRLRDASRGVHRRDGMCRKPRGL